MRTAFLVAPEGGEQVEITSPWEALVQTGDAPQLVSTRPGRIQAFNHLDKGDTFPVDLTVDDASADDFDLLVLPGGVANPDELRTDEKAVAFVRGFFDAGKPVAAICHAAWTLIEAGVLDGRTLTSFPSLRTDVTNAGGTWKDEQVVIDTSGPSTLITSRRPDDLDAFNKAVLREVGALT